MKIIKKLISFTTVIFSLFFIISCSKTASTTFSIELLNIEASGINNETVYQGFSYSKSSSVIITATFSDGTEKNVTNDAKFGKISTSTQVNKNDISVILDTSTRSYAENQLFDKSAVDDIYIIDHHMKREGDICIEDELGVPSSNFLRDSNASSVCEILVNEIRTRIKSINC